MEMSMKKAYLSCIFVVFCTIFGHGQYRQAERDDTIRMKPTVPFDSVATKAALVEGTGTIKGVAFTRAKSQQLGFKAGKRILANKILVTLYPLTPYFEAYLDLRKKVNPKKLKFAYIDPGCYRLRLTSVTNSSGEFTFPKMKPGKYYICGELPWFQTGTYNKYSGTANTGYGQVNYYTPTSYRNDHTDYLEKIVEITQEGQILEVKLK